MSAVIHFGVSAVAACLLVVLAGCSYRVIEPPGEVIGAGPVFASSTPSITRRFFVTNTTDRRVRILGESHSCTCTEARLDRAVLDPGQSTPLDLLVHIPQGYAKRDVACIVETDHPEFPEWSYHLRFESFPRARIVPERVDLGILRAEAVDGASSEAKLEIFAPADEELPRPIPVASSAGLLLALDCRPEQTLLTGGVRRASHRLTIRLAGRPSTPGTSVVPINITIGDGPPASATVTWTYAAPLVYSPQQVHFGIVGREDLPRTIKVTLRSVDGKPFRLLSLDDGSPHLRVRSSAGGTYPSSPAPFHILELELRAGEDGIPSILSGVVRIRTDLTVLSEVAIPWSVFPRRVADGLGTGALGRTASEQTSLVAGEEVSLSEEELP